MSQPLATIIVVTHDSARWLEQQRTALAAQTETRWRLIVFDNASRAEERPRLADLPAGARLMQSETNLGFAEANNLAAAHAETPYLAFLNPDAFPEPEWLARLLETADRHPEAGAIGSTQVRANATHLFDGTGDVLHASGLAYRSNYGRPRRASPPLSETFSACAAAMLVRRDAFEAVGGFDPRYFCYFEDVDLGFRLRLQGWRILQSPDAVVLHVGGGSAGVRTAFADFHGARNRFWTFVKCMPGPLFWPLLPVHLAATASAAAYALASGRGVSAWRGLAAGVAGIGPAWRERVRLQANRKVASAAIAAALAWSPLAVIGRQPVMRRIASA